MRRLLAIGAVAGAGAWLGRRARRRLVDWSPPAGDIHRGTLVARTLGTKGTPVLLLHGLAASGRSWGAAFDVLADEHRLIVPDLLGFGASPRPASGYGPGEHVEALAACLAEVGADDEPMIIGAHSAGALLAINLAARAPERVRAVVGLAAPLYRSPAEARAHIGRMGPMARLFVLDTTWAHRVCKWVCDHRDAAALVAQAARPDLPAPIARDGVQHNWASYSETLRRVLLAADSRDVLAKVRCPVHLVAGARDHISPPALLEGLDATPGLEHETWPGVGHDLPLLRPGACVELLAHAARGA